MSSGLNKIVYALPKFSRRNYAVLMKTLENIHNFDISDIAQFRFHVLQHFYQYGLSSTLNAFNVKKSTLYDWKKRYEKSKKQLSSLIPKSTRPKKIREMIVDWRLVDFIKEMRFQYGNLSKYKLKPFLDEYAKEIGVSSYSLGKIGKIVKRKNFFFEGQKKRIKSRRKPFSPRVNKSPHVSSPGYLEIDTVIVYFLSEKFYFTTAIDIYTKTAWCHLSRSHSSRQARELLKEFLYQSELKVHTVQTDNGSEFLGKFHDYLLDEKIEHKFIYLRSPKINGVVERFNRTIQEECINRYYDLLCEPEKMKKKLKEYLLWYNLRRPHCSLHYKTPFNFLQELS